MSRIIPELVIKTDFFGEGYTHKFYDVEVEDIQLYETQKAYKDKAWYIQVRDREYEICPPPHKLIKEARPRAEKILLDIETQIKNAKPKDKPDVR